MTDWELSACKRLERNVENIVARMRDTASQIEREARLNVASASNDRRSLEFHTYPRVAGEVIHAVQTLLFSLGFDSLINAAGDAEAARASRHHEGGKDE